MKRGEKMRAHLEKGELVLEADTPEDRKFLREAFDTLRLKKARLLPTATHIGEKLTLAMKKETKYRLLIRIWVKQDKLYDTAKAAHEAGEKIAKPEDIAVERVDE